MRRARHRRPGRLEVALAVLAAASGELGPGVQEHVMARYVMDWVRP